MPNLEIVKLIRPHQWIKNSFVLLGVVFSHQLGNHVLLNVVLAFLAFCAIASAIYVVNDILDVVADRQHPTKWNRPLASGKLSMTSARIMMAALLLLSFP